MRRNCGNDGTDHLHISPRFTVNDWVRARDSNEWSIMLRIFRDRLEGRFLRPARLIENDIEIGEFSGFSIIAIDCLIIETLNQFALGVDETQGPHANAFWRFFKNSKHFQSHFTEKTATVFYKHFRCGILHQAQTKGRSRVRFGEKHMIQIVNDNPDEGLIVDRKRFHAALEAEVLSYITQLEVGDSELRDNFVRKMNTISGL